MTKKIMHFLLSFIFCGEYDIQRFSTKDRIRPFRQLLHIAVTLRVLLLGWKISQKRIIFWAYVSFW